MRTRSSRLFAVLLHVVGVSTNLPTPSAGSGSTVINPLSVILEVLRLDEDGLDSLIRKAIDESDEEESYILSEPFWIQDQADGLCLSPFGFSDCGDASLWYIRSKSKKRQRIWARSKPSQDENSYGLEYLNTENTKRECLLTSKRRVLKENAPLPFGSCSSHPDRVFGWKIDGRGILHSYKGKTAKNSVTAQCLWRYNSTGSTLGFCSPDFDNGPIDGRRLAKLSLVKHESAAAAAKRAEKRQTPSSKVSEKGENSAVVQTQQDEPKTAEEEQIHPQFIDRAHSHASEPVHHRQPKLTQRLSGGVVGKSESSGDEQNKLLIRPKIKDHKLVNAGQKEKAKKNPTRPVSSLSSNTVAYKSKKPEINDAAQKLRRLETHPYIAAAKDEMWTDPQTGLKFRTDLCKYLGHDLKSAGRHTLTGVGYYTKTMMKIKIYGVALYVSKRDILADPPFEDYASMTSSELRLETDFYDHLSQMPSAIDPTTGFFDRTIFLKLNMQLSVETMQSSLRATWKLLTDERKNLLINSSTKPRPAEEQMLKLIQSSENAGRCSCGQVAPPEYKADRTCCARGTELVFTWRKNGDLEIRLDGRLMDTFPRPDVARGIFYEYLRTDDPIAPDFSEKVIDGFPFLLGPLSRVKGTPYAINMNEHQQEEDLKSLQGSGNRNLINMFSSQAGELSGWVQTGANNAGNVARALGDTARSVTEGFDRRRDQLFRQVSILPENGINFVRRRMARTRQDELAMTLSNYLQRYERGEILMKEKGGQPAPRGRIFRSFIDRWFGLQLADDVILSDSKERKEGSLLGHFVFFLMVHFYLLLLLIVSFPGKHNTISRARISRLSKEDKYLERLENDEQSSTQSSSSMDDPFLPQSSDWTIGSDDEELNAVDEDAVPRNFLSRLRPVKRPSGGSFVTKRERNDLVMEESKSVQIRKSISFSF
mmetsp:Transcript_27624/g.40786  ORF Transcript_27624/g.40786 Transcript_27624/m.40786 type:complete len:934 (+) Transcript_27624:202-3003(+)